MHQTTRKDLYWGYAAQGLNIGAGLILLPIVLRKLSPEDVGLWFVFITLAGLAQLLEFGFQPTLARNTAYVYAGAKSLNKMGLPTEFRENNSIDLELLSGLIIAARKIYRFVGLVAAFALILGGTTYIYSVVTPSQDVLRSVIAWTAFAAGYVANFYFGYFNGLLQGRGNITDANKVVIISRVVMIVCGAGSLIMGLGLLGLGFSSLLSSICSRVASHHYFYKSASAQRIVPNAIYGDLLVKILWHNASRMGLVQLGAFLIQRANILIASSFLGLATAASYGMTSTVLITISGVAMVICHLQIPHMNGLQAAGNQKKLAAILGCISILASSILIFGSFILIFFGNEILRLISSGTPLIPTEILVFVCTISLLELNHSIAATYLTTTNRIPFLKAAIFSGFAVMGLSLALVENFGLWGVVFAQGFVQALYNNWKWPLEAIKDLNVSVYQLFSAGFFEIKALLFHDHLHDPKGDRR